jgi:hypothetical protein
LALKRNFQISREPNEERGGILGLKYADPRFAIGFAIGFGEASD